MDDLPPDIRRHIAAYTYIGEHPTIQLDLTWDDIYNSIEDEGMNPFDFIYWIYMYDDPNLSWDQLYDVLAIDAGHGDPTDTVWGVLQAFVRDAQTVGYNPDTLLSYKLRVRHRMELYPNNPILERISTSVIKIANDPRANKAIDLNHGHTTAANNRSRSINALISIRGPDGLMRNMNFTLGNASLSKDEMKNRLAMIRDVFG